MNMQRQKIAGLFLAENENDLRLKLGEQGLYLISSTVSSDKSPNAFFSLTGTVSTSDLTTFCRQFSIMADVGIPVVEIFDILKKQAFSDFFKKILEMVHEDIKGGVSLSNALKKHKKVFPDFFRSMISVGEASGKLDQVLNSMADYYEREDAIKKSTKSALMYPCILIVMAIGILFLITLFVVPTFSAALADMGIADEDMPAITTAIMNLSTYMQKNWMYLLLAVVLVVAVVKIIGKTRKGRLFFDYVKLNAPILKDVNINLISAKFARTFSLLLTSGMDVIDSLEQTSGILGNTFMQKQLNDAIDDVRQGMSLTQAFESRKLFPPLMLQMITVGEKTATLEEVIGNSCAFFDDNAERKMKSMVSLIQPVVLGVIGLSVGVLFYAIYAPLLTVMNTFG